MAPAVARVTTAAPSVEHPVEEAERTPKIRQGAEDVSGVLGEEERRRLRERLEYQGPRAEPGKLRGRNGCSVVMGVSFPLVHVLCHELRRAFVSETPCSRLYRDVKDRLCGARRIGRAVKGNWASSEVPSSPSYPCHRSPSSPSSPNPSCLQDLVGEIPSWLPAAPSALVPSCRPAQLWAVLEDEKGSIRRRRGRP